MSNYLDKLQSSRKKERLREEEENYLNLWSYLRRRYPETNIENMGFWDLIDLKNNLEGPRILRYSDHELAMVIKR